MGKDDVIPQYITWDGHEAAKLLRCGRKTLCELAEKGVIPGMYYGKGWKFNRDAILEIVAYGGIEQWLSQKKSLAK